MKSNKSGRPRPAVFRALGKHEPPQEITVEGESFSLVNVFKHDSWAATGLYESPEGRKIVCKINRRQSIFGFPMAWLGRRLARREAFFYSLFSDLECVPRGYEAVSADGKRMKSAFAHDYIEGGVLNRGDRFPAEFYDKLEENIALMHERGAAYMDLHKMENVIVGDDGNPYLVDFQVAFALSRKFWSWPMRWLLRMFQKADKYHLVKHRCSSLPKSESGKILAKSRPGWIKVHRFFAIPLRQLRRNFLVLLGIRKGKGYVHSEHFIECGLRGECNENPETIKFPVNRVETEVPGSDRKTA